MTTPAKPQRRSHAQAREEAIDQILDIATREFVEKGLAGARIDEIAEQTSKRKIYYYFGGKDELYRAVLERAYHRMRDSESTLAPGDGTAAEALRRIIEHDVTYHAQHPDLVRLVMNENIHHAEHLRQIESIREKNRGVIDVLAGILERGAREGLFRDAINPVELHMTISALAFYNVSNQHTFSHNFGVDMTSPEAVARRAKQVADIILAWVARSAVVSPGV
ncbi:TetR family transcriptional regulator [Novosphingobium profundi]|uniref:TetR/AcrR family transcriptional regulator n=1 Tax=Novosphingobium profundi TaxID=1774954 RepID=UPI001BD92813|nr:TetR family transcriptional regulator [Novosphingobium profundi]